MTQQKIILISGLLESGKSTLSNEIFWYLNRDVETMIRAGDHPLYSKLKQYSFATKVKEIARDCFGWDGKKDEKGRKLLQRIGTDVGRFYNKDLWVDYFSDFMNNNTHPNEQKNIYLIDDWRFRNEVENIKFDYNGFVYKIRVKREVERNSDEMNHPSENSLPLGGNYYDFIFENDYISIDKMKKSKQFKKLINSIINFINN